jgi:hypothetical protein
MNLVIDVGLSQNTVNVVLFKGWFDQPIPRLNSGFDKGEAKLVS